MKVERYIFICVVYAVLCILACGCRPRGVLSSRQMRRVMIDLHKTDALLQVCGLHTEHDSIEDAAYASVLERHGITQAQFDSSLVWYTNHPQLFDKIYPKVLAALNDENQAFSQAHADELEVPAIAEENAAAMPLSDDQAKEAIDRLLWVNRHGLPSLWNERPASSPTVRIPYSL